MSPSGVGSTRDISTLYIFLFLWIRSDSGFNRAQSSFVKAAKQKKGASNSVLCVNYGFIQALREREREGERQTERERGGGCSPV